MAQRLPGREGDLDASITLRVVFLDSLPAALRDGCGARDRPMHALQARKAPTSGSPRAVTWRRWGYMDVRNMRVLGHAGAAGDDLTQRVVVRTQHVEHREEAAHLVCVARNRVPPQRSLRQQRAQHRARSYSVIALRLSGSAGLTLRCRLQSSRCVRRARRYPKPRGKRASACQGGRGATEVRLYVYTARIDADSPPYVPHRSAGASSGTTKRRNSSASTTSRAGPGTVCIISWRRAPSLTVSWCRSERTTNAPKHQPRVAQSARNPLQEKRRARFEYITPSSARRLGPFGQPAQLGRLTHRQTGPPALALSRAPTTSHPSSLDQPLPPPPPTHLTTRLLQRGFCDVIKGTSRRRIESIRI